MHFLTVLLPPGHLGLVVNVKIRADLLMITCLLISWLQSPSAVILEPKKINQSILKEINIECSLQGLMLKLKLQYFGHLMQRTNSLEKTLMLEKIEGRRRRG